MGKQDALYNSPKGCGWWEVPLLTLICVMWVGRSKMILFMFRSPVAFQWMPAQNNTWHEARNFLCPEVQNKQQIENSLAESSSLLTSQVGSAPAWLGLNQGTMITLSRHTQACVLALGEKDAGSSAGAAAASGNINIPLWSADVCLPYLPQGILPWTCWNRAQLSAILCQMPQPPPWEHVADMQDDVLLISLPLFH